MNFRTRWTKLTPMHRIMVLGTAALVALLVLCCGVSAIGAMVAPAPKAKPSTEFVPLHGAVSTAPSPSDSPGPSPSYRESPTPDAVPATTALPTTALPTTAPPTTRAAPPPATHTTTKRVPPPPKPAPTTHDQYAHGVHPGAFCAPGGALGYTVNGTLMRCTTTATDSRNRWRRA